MALSPKKFVTALQPLKEMMSHLAVNRCQHLCERLLEWAQEVKRGESKSRTSVIGHFINAYGCFIQLFAEYLMFLEHEMSKLLKVKPDLHQLQ